MDKKYISPKMEIIELEAEDVIVTSVTGGKEQGNDVEDP